MRDGRDIIRSRDLLYSDTVGRDACGIGGVAAREGKPSHEVIVKSLMALSAMEHRGGVCGTSGDGAGLTCQLPQSFFRSLAVELFGPKCGLLDNSLLAIGSFMLPKDEGQAAEARKLAAQDLSFGDIKLIGWRKVPVNDDKIPTDVVAARPNLEQAFLPNANCTGGA